jgi:hypothetical protein
MSAKVLIFDIETSPIIAHVWGLYDQNIGLNQIQSDWHLLSWSAKWLGSKKVMYADQRKAKDISNDKKILQGLWKLLDAADIVITQNGKRFDAKKVNARFLYHGMAPPSSYKHIDTLLIAKKHFGFTSNKLAYMTAQFCTKYKKLEHRDFPGHEMWVECLKGNLKAWRAMEKYNRYDVLSLEELYTKLIPWDSTINFNLYHNSTVNTCPCGSTEFKQNGFFYSSVGKFQRYRCTKCGAEGREGKNLLKKGKRVALLRKTR